ncbi:hypothetical protein [Myceligenerans pegani]|uniref:Integral membrane protein n=1 Tax=Myceligenerans pegani TaxID=2776917 RepID=A0ABR9N0M0_9MICO|nr:hypothetical protein [Myceligenerans sp. TRM 65318]MBE1876786.1 hypothetical protein [Myceligenerans sp. TRM 65318]MBE3019057.1 hypothetical protein [Myceligenerans sp. TRM 65318]
MGELGQVMRVVRTILLASTSLSLATLAHSLGGGELPGTGPMVVLGILTVSASCVVAGVRPRVWVLAPFLGALQFLLHQTLSWSTLASAAATPGTVQSLGHAGHHAGTATTPATAQIAADAAHSHLSSPRMTALHVAAILATAALMAAGEGTARVALQVFGHVLPALTAPRVPAPVRPAFHPRPALTPTPSSVLVARSTPRRGPPAALAVLA